MDKKTYALRGIIVHTPDFNTIEYHENEYVVCEDGVSKGIFKELPEEYREIPVIDYKDKFIIPGMCDMHVHAPQYGFRGIGRAFGSATRSGRLGLTNIPSRRRAAIAGYCVREKGVHTLCG